MSELSSSSATEPWPAARRSTSGVFGALVRFWQRQHVPIALVAGWCVMLALLLRGHRDNGPTEDEFTHMVRGLALWRQGDTWIPSSGRNASRSLHSNARRVERSPASAEEPGQGPADAVER